MLGMNHFVYFMPWPLDSNILAYVLDTLHDFRTWNDEKIFSIAANHFFGFYSLYPRVLSFGD